MGRDKRMEYAASFEICYYFRLLYYSGSFYPIMGALRYAYSSILNHQKTNNQLNALVILFFQFLDLWFGETCFFFSG
jgi:hypothetical protein